MFRVLTPLTASASKGNVARVDLDFGVPAFGKIQSGGDYDHPIASTWKSGNQVRLNLMGNRLFADLICRDRRVREVPFKCGQPLALSRDLDPLPNQQWMQAHVGDVLGSLCETTTSQKGEDQRPRKSCHSRRNFCSR